MSHETLSALLDGECTPVELDRLLDELERSPELREAWSRMCLARDAQEGVRITRDQASICDAVMARLDAEDVAVGNPKVVDFATWRRAAPQFLSARWKPAAGMAAAAAVGAAAVLVAMPQAESPAGGSAAIPARIASPAALPLPATRRPRNLQAVSLSPEELQQEQELDTYLIEHSNTLADRGFGGTLSHARFSAQKADFRPEDAPQEGAGDTP